MIKGKTKIFLLAGVILLVLLVGCTSSSEGEVELTPDPNTWKVFNSEVFGYSIQHPSLWSVYDSKPEEISFKNNTEEFVVVKVYGIVQGWSASEIIDRRMQYIKGNTGEADYSNWSKGKGRWEGSWELVYEFSSNQGERLKAREVAIPSSNYVYEVAGSFPVESEGDPSGADVVNAVMNSFRVIVR